MRERQIRNFESMAQFWASRVRDLRAELDQQLLQARPVYPQLRARLRQSALCLVMAQEQVEFLTGALNAARDEAFLRYTLAITVLSELSSEVATE